MFGLEWGAAMAFVAAVLYAISEAYKGYKKGEKFEVVQFVKTVVVAAVAAGYISLNVGDQIVAFASTGFVTYIADKLLNAFFKRQK